MFGKLKIFINSHASRLGFELINLLFCYDWLFKLVGKWNQKKQLIKAVFMTYPATSEYAAEYCYFWRRQKAKWQPHLAGLFCQNGKWGIMFVVSASNDDFREQENYSQVKALCQRMENLRQIFGAEQKTFGGILPAVLGRSRLVKEMHELEMTLAVSAQSLYEIRRLEQLDFYTPVIVLSSSISMETRVRKAFGHKCGEIIFINSRQLEQKDTVESALLGAISRPAILINLAAGEDLEKMSALLWPQVVVLNEAYLKNMRELRQIFSQLGCGFYQIAGVKGRTYPRMPGVYGNSIPCCQGWVDDQMTPVLIKLK